MQSNEFLLDSPADTAGQQTLLSFEFRASESVRRTCTFQVEGVILWALPNVGHARADQNEDVEIPWWTYGARGMQLWFPKTLEEPLLAPAPGGSHYATDPELEFDREVYPVGISLSEVSIVGKVLSTEVVYSQPLPLSAMGSYNYVTLLFHQGCTYTTRLGSRQSSPSLGHPACKNVEFEEARCGGLPQCTADTGVTQRAQRTGAYITEGGTPTAQGVSAGRAGHGQGSASHYAHAQLPLFQPLPESQPVLPCLLRRLLQQVISASRQLAMHRAHDPCLT